MIKKRNRILIAILVLMTAISMFGCGDQEKDTDSRDKSTSVAVDESKTTTDESITTKEGISSPDAVSSDESDDEDISKSSSDDSDKTKSKSTDKSSKSKSKKKSVNSQKSKIIKCKIAIDCKTLYKKDPDLASQVSTNGIILSTKTVELKKNATVYDALKASGVSFTGKKYISKINGLSEKDGGKLSGWIYTVNGEVPMYSCDEYKVKNGDDIRWRYTCNNGSDL